jgi:uncharacterized membrane protein YeaQ/YmgE (transglycosylase-associated protein family)
MFHGVCLTSARRGMMRVHGFPTEALVLIFGLPLVAGLLVGWLASRIADSGLLLSLVLAVIGAFAGLFLLDQAFTIGPGSADAELKALINYGIKAIIGAVVAIIPAWLISRARR